MKIYSCSKNAFTLVEISIALGVTAFCLVALMGLLPLGLTTNQTSIEQTVAAGIAASITADLRATPAQVSTSAAVIPVSPFFKVPIAASVSSFTHTLFIREDGTALGTIDTDAVASLSPKYRATLVFNRSGIVSGRCATPVRVMVTWPALADPKQATMPSKYAGMFEAVISLDRN